MQASRIQGQTGLTEAEARSRLSEYGPNRVKKPVEVRFFSIVREEITEPMILLLFIVGIFYSILGSLDDAITIFAIIAALVLVEVWNEYRAKKAITALGVIAAPKTKVIREGKQAEVESELIVPGDIIVLTPGTRIAADARLISAVSLQIDESSLTGESFPVEKAPGEEVFGGTLVRSGEGIADVVRTGAATRMGKIAEAAVDIKPPRTPLQLAMKALAKTLVWVALFFSIIIPFIGFLQGKPAQEMFLTGLALAFATIPEELPIVITMNLGMGSYQLSKENFLVKKLKAAETLGNTTVILTDKTGTITESTMKVAAVIPAEKEREILGAAMSSMTGISLAQTDRAIVERAAELGIPVDDGKPVSERTFGDGRNTRAILRAGNGDGVLYVAGAPEEIVARLHAEGAPIMVAVNAEAEKGRRVIAVAHRKVDPSQFTLPFEELEKSLEIDGIISIEDPPRPGVRETIEKARLAGVRTIMVTGDHPSTAAFIAKSVGIDAGRVMTGEDLDTIPDEDLRKALNEVSVFARTTPEHKYRLVKVLQKSGDVVAVTGDGVNDSLALKGADIGIAMGIKGTDAAKEAADIVLADDDFVTVGKGIFAGRRIYDNLRKGVKYYLSVKAALVAIFLAAILVSVPFPFSPIQIIVLELFMDLGASAAFVAEPAASGILRRPPKAPGEKFIGKPMLTGIAFSGIALFATVLIPYFFAIRSGFSTETAQTYAFAAWIIGTVFLAFVSRSDHDTLLSLGVISNRVMDLWAIGAFGFLAVLLLFPSIGANFRVSPISPAGAGIIVLVAALCMGGLELLKFIRNHLVGTGNPSGV